MASTRIVIGIVVTAASSLVALAACSGSTTSSGTGDGGASSGTSGSNTSGGGTSGSNSGGVKQCPTSGSTCTEAESATYSSCIQDKCDSTYSKCFGGDYKSGTYGGDCGTYITCTQACACNDTACLAKCTITDACKTCLIPAASNCSAMCEAPACAKGGSSGSSGSSGTSGGGGTKTCADLKACCDRIPAGQMQDSCNQTYESIKTMESSCNAVYAGYAPSCP